MTSLRLVRAASLCTLLALAACATSKSKTDLPAELTAYPSTVRVERVWSTRVGNSAPKLKIGLALAMEGNSLFAASYAGDVVAYNRANGRRLWNTPTKIRISGGPGAGEGLVVVGGNHGDIVALDAATGAVKWKSFINSEILAAPYIGSQVVLLRAVDGRLVALRADNGTQLWSVEQAVPRLSLRGTSRPVVAGNLAVSGFDNGRVLALEVGNGLTVLDAIVAPSSGRTELERLNDVDSRVEVRGNDVFAVNFHGKVARIELQTGEIQWSREASSFTGLALDDDSLYLTDATGKVQKLAQRDGVQAWSNEALLNRRLSPPVLLGEHVVVADFEGFVHFLDRGTGELAGRAALLAGPVSAQPLAAEDTLYMLDVTGSLVALRAATVAAGTGSTTATGSNDRESAPLRPR